MSSNSNWPGGVDRGHPNFTGRTPRVSKYDGKGAFSPDSSRIPPGAWVGAACVVGLFAWIAIIGAIVGF